MSVKEAAERLRKHRDCKDDLSASPYGYYNYDHMKCREEWCIDFHAQSRDEAILAEAYLASHRPDDDELIDVAFVKSLGFRNEIDAKMAFTRSTDDGWLFCVNDGEDVGMNLAIRNLTKGQLRRLVELLGGKS